MYLNFYSLKREPFHITPDPEFLYLSPSHKEALAAIIYGIEQRKGFVGIIGAVGVGKTTIVRTYLESVNKEKTKVIYIFNARLTFEGLLRAIYQELDLALNTNDIFDMINNLYKVLIDEYVKGNNIVLVIDEAQNIPIDTLEDLRMLSNLETSKDKLIQIVLIGQPEFGEGLNLERLRQLKQRIAIRANILPLSDKESLQYIEHRLRKAGLHSGAVFTQDALKLISKTANGIPRIINIMCDNALINGFGYQEKPVSSKIVREVIRDTEGKRRKSHLTWRLAFVIAASFVVVGFFLTAYYYGQWPSLKSLSGGSSDKVAFSTTEKSVARKSVNRVQADVPNKSQKEEGVGVKEKVMGPKEEPAPTKISVETNVAREVQVQSQPEGARPDAKKRSFARQRDSAKRTLQAEKNTRLSTQRW